MHTELKNVHFYYKRRLTHFLFPNGIELKCKRYRRIVIILSRDI